MKDASSPQRGRRLSGVAGCHCVVKLLCWPCLLWWLAAKLLCLPCIASYCRRFFACCICKCCWFTDKQFPPSGKSLGGKFESDSSIEWIRARDITPAKWADSKNKSEPKPMQLFEGDIEPADIAQGAIGDCWLMAAFACLAEYPGRLQNVFENRETASRGKYTVRLYNNGELQEVDIDEYIPCCKGKPKFAKPNGNEMWVMLLEKAVAKFCGGYHNLDGGLTGWGIQVLTGDPCFFLEREPGPGNKWRRKNLRTEGESGRRKCFVVRTNEVYEAEKLFDILFEYKKKEAILAAANDGEGGDSAANAKNGICQGHAYSLLDVRVVAGFKLLKCRNPWGTFEWTGKWSDKSDMWDKNPRVKDQLEEDGGMKNDGTFWMEFDDFSTNFNGIDVIDRSTGERDLALRIDEDQGCCGPCVGCVVGCCKFWCCCKGCGVLCCARKADGITRKGERGCCDNERACC